MINKIFLLLSGAFWCMDGGKKPTPNQTNKIRQKRGVTAGKREHTVVFLKGTPHPLQGLVMAELTFSLALSSLK